MAPRTSTSSIAHHAVPQPEPGAEREMALLRRMTPPSEVRPLLATVGTTLLLMMGFVLWQAALAAASFGL